MNSGNNSGDAEKPSVALEVSPKTDSRAKNRPTKGRNKDTKNSPDISTWFKEIRAEAGKIIWPNKKELAKMTFTVVVTSLFFGVLITGMDIIFRYATGFLSGISNML